MHVSSLSRLQAVAVALSAVAFAAAPAARAATYHLVDLGEAYAVGINNAGMVAGNQLGDTKPMRWVGGHWHNLRQNPFASATWAINLEGDVSGYANWQPAVWRRGTADYTLLAVPAGTRDGIATAITADRRAAGYMFDGPCVVWDADGNVTDIGMPRHTSDCQARGIDPDGDVAVIASGLGFVWRNGHYKEIGTLGGSSSWAMAINRYGHVAGMATDASGQQHAIVWKGGTLTDLGTPDSSYTDLAAWALNDRGAAVGSGWSNNDEAFHAILFDQGQAVELNSVVDDLADWNLTDAFGISDDGTIVGVGLRGQYADHAFMLVPMASK